MEIKDFDMVECDGEIRRVMMSSTYDDEVYVDGKKI